MVRLNWSLAHAVVKIKETLKTKRMSFAILLIKLRYFLESSVYGHRVLTVCPLHKKLKRLAPKKPKHVSQTVT